ncbi:MAG: amidohydrolase/deacetylase family metallohydrolase, partial [Phyllobacterium sp.]
LSVGMPFDKVVEAVTLSPASAIGLPTEDLLSVGKRADFTLFDLADSDLKVIDSMGYEARLDRLFEPRLVVLGNETITASRYQPAKPELSGAIAPYSYR